MATEHRDWKDVLREKLTELDKQRREQPTLNMRVPKKIQKNDQASNHEH